MNSSDGQTLNAASSLDWRPDLDQAIGELSEIMNAHESQQEMNYTIANLSALYDAKLYIIFQRELIAAPEREQDRLLDIQRHWLQLRAANMKSVSDNHEGGSMQAFVAGTTFIDDTKRRIVELESAAPRLTVANVDGVRTLFGNTLEKCGVSAIGIAALTLELEPSGRVMAVNYESDLPSPVVECIKQTMSAAEFGPGPEAVTMELEFHSRQSMTIRRVERKTFAH